MELGITTTPLGPMLLAAHGEKLTGAWYREQLHFPPFPEALVRDAVCLSPAPEGAPGPAASLPSQRTVHPVLQQAADELARYFSGNLRTFTVPLVPTGTPFQESVWQALLAIPYGATWSYSAIAERVGRPSAVRAVGTAIGRNPLGIFIPCHRVVGKDGSLTGYAGGLDKKRILLDLEQNHTR